MYTDFAVDLSLPSAECESAATPVGVEYLCDVDTAALDRAIDFSAPSTSDQFFDFGLPELENCHPNPTTSQWPMLSPPPSLLRSPASPTHSNKQPEVVSKGKQRSSDPRASQSSMQKVDRARKTKGSQRPHYAVEKRYRSTLNEKYAALARTLSSEAVQRICRTDSRDWAAHVDGTSASSKDEQGTGSRQRKTATLSVTTETINILSRCCRREAKDLEQLRCSIHETRNRIQHMLETKTQQSREQHGGG